MYRSSAVKRSSEGRLFRGTVYTHLAEDPHAVVIVTFPGSGPIEYRYYRGGAAQADAVGEDRLVEFIRNFEPEKAASMAIDQFREKLNAV